MEDRLSEGTLGELRVRFLPNSSTWHSIKGLNASRRVVQPDHVDRPKIFTPQIVMASSSKTAAPPPAAKTVEVGPASDPKNKRTRTTEDEEAAQPSQATISPPKTAGNFDIYSANLPFLKEVYLPAGKTDPQYEALYATILTYQAKPDYTGRCYLPDTDSSTGRFVSACIADPMSDEEYDIEINAISAKAKLTFTAAERKGFGTPSPTTIGSGISAKLRPAEDHCGLASGSGVFKLTPVWQKHTSSGEVQELYEGYISFNVKYSSLYSRKGFGSGDKFACSFWAVHARKDKDGKEIGLH
ncbi:hypothetical protein A0H81_04472 [Grifola frondosa]|uniref:Uncharacterized protein n=1 Tax=Grifola frondosa TaxID=5627 RepID=A0A1C7MFM2_GRIFR|nr:hypothetical protein A0H81_04472 [Grifola frondosa]